jgi:hypothetical protein
VPRPYTAIELTDFRQATHALSLPRRALLRAALTLIKVSPLDALGVFEVYEDHSEGWRQLVLLFPEARGELIYEADEVERVIVLRSVIWR